MDILNTVIAFNPLGLAQRIPWPSIESYVIENIAYLVPIFIIFAFSCIFAAKYNMSKCSCERIPNRHPLFFRVFFIIFLSLPLLFLFPVTPFALFVEGAIALPALQDLITYLLLCLLLVTLYVMSDQDYNTMLLPLPGQALIFILSLLMVFVSSDFSGSALLSSLWTSLMVFGIVTSFYIFFSLLFRREAFGQGDIILLVSLSPLMGSPAFLLPLIFIAAPIGAIISIAAILMAPAEPESLKVDTPAAEGLTSFTGVEVPFGPFLAAGWAITFTVVTLVSVS